VAAAPPGNPAVIANWQGQLLARLQRYKRYPETARYRREEGVAQLGFTMDREGHVLTAVILRSSGSAALDAEALALVYRAEPLPPPPADMAGARLNLSVPLNFSLSGR
jgi:protein TonB